MLYISQSYGVMRNVSNCSDSSVTVIAGSTVSPSLANATSSGTVNTGTDTVSPGTTLTVIDVVTIPAEVPDSSSTEIMICCSPNSVEVYLSVH